MALQKSCVETCSFSSFQSILQKTKGEIQPFLYVSMRGQHRPAEPSLKAFKGQDNFIQLLASSLWFMSGSAAATRREEVHVKGLDGPKYSSILRPFETEIQFVISWVQVWRGQTSCAQQDLHLTDFSGKFPVSYWKIKREFQRRCFGQYLQFCLRNQLLWDANHSLAKVEAVNPGTL